MFVKNRSFHFRTFKKNMQNQNKLVGNSQSFAPSPRSSTELLPLYMCCNIHHFGITKRKVMASKLQVTPTKLQVTPTKLQVTPTKLQVTRVGIKRGNGYGMRNRIAEADSGSGIRK